MKQIKLFLITILPSFLLFLLLPMWFRGNRYIGIAKEVGLIFSIIYIVLTVIYNLVIAILNKQRWFIFNSFILLLSSFIITLNFYLLWSISIGNIFSPDGETVIIMGYYLRFYLISVIIGCVISQIVLSIISKYRK